MTRATRKFPVCKSSSTEAAGRALPRHGDRRAGQGLGKGHVLLPSWHNCDMMEENVTPLVDNFSSLVKCRERTATGNFAHCPWELLYSFINFQLFFSPAAHTLLQLFFSPAAHTLLQLFFSPAAHTLLQLFFSPAAHTLLQLFFSPAAHTLLQLFFSPAAHTLLQLFFSPAAHTLLQLFFSPAAHTLLQLFFSPAAHTLLFVTLFIPLASSSPLGIV
eukprot:XP_014025237.1 PREDICTED: uncharacterized protein LOC106584434 [Salmo salar]